MAAGGETKRARAGVNPLLSGEPEPQEGPSRTRRRLLKGTLSAPVILTLYSGAALAQKSLTALVATNDTYILGGDADPTGDSDKAVCAEGTPEYNDQSGGYVEFDTLTCRVVEAKGNVLATQQSECKDGVIIAASSAVSLCY